MAQTVLIADIGGTSSRIALAGADGVPFDVKVETNDSYSGIEDLIGTYLDGLRDPKPKRGIFAVAGPIDGDDVRLTNRPWQFAVPDLARTLGLTDLEVLNDFAALAHGVTRLKREDLVSVGPGRAVAGAPILVCGPGTGLGAALVLPRGADVEVLPSEAGHMRFGAVTASEARVLAHMVRDFGAVSVEHVLSGPGLVRLHRVLTGEQLSSHLIIKAAIAGQRNERETCEVFLNLLGRVLGDLCLAFDAKGGIYVAGGIARAMAPLFPESPFRKAFEDHPPFTDRLSTVPVQVVVHATPGLVGAGCIARRRLAA